MKTSNGEKKNMNPAADTLAQAVALSPMTQPPAHLPDEPAADYAVFLEYWRHGTTVRQRILAEKLGISPSRFSRLKRRWRWEERIMAHQSSIPVLPDIPEEWLARREDTRQAEWDEHLETMEAAREALARWRASDKIPSFAEIAKMIDLSSRLARLATGMPLHHAQLTGQNGGPIRIEFEAALKRVYGEPEPIEITAN
jgi:hypothetical protein